MISYLEHFYSFLADNDLAKNMARWERAGFPILKNYTRHEPGLENGFVQLTGAYLEFVSVLDMTKFLVDAEESYRNTYKEPRIIGCGAISLDTYLLHKKIISFYPNAEPCYSMGTADDPSTPIWTYCKVPMDVSPGLYVFALKYLTKKPGSIELIVGPNTIFGITGLALCSKDHYRKLKIWQNTYQQILKGYSSNSDGFKSPAQTVRFISPDQYKEIFLEEWQQKEGSYYDTAAIILGASNPKNAFDMMTAEGFNCHWTSQGEEFVVSKDRNSGFAFIVQKGSAEDFAISLNSLIQ